MGKYLKNLEDSQMASEHVKNKTKQKMFNFINRQGTAN